MDRNRSTLGGSGVGSWSLSARRAWIEILSAVVTELLILLSLSARRAWIEISGINCKTAETAVALRKESVDRNRLVAGSLITLGGSLSARRAWIEIVAWLDYSEELLQSLSARRAWIEIMSLNTQQRHNPKSLSARRAWIEILVTIIPSNFSNGRSPQGERG